MTDIPPESTTAKPIDSLKDGLEDSPTGLTFASLGAFGAASAVEFATLAENSGYNTFWTAEATGPEAFATLAATGQTTSQIALGTGVLALQLRTPTLTAMGASTLQNLFPDRDILLGVGISSPVVVGRWHGNVYGASPLSQTREFVGIVRTLIDGTKHTHEGDHYDLGPVRIGTKVGDRKPKLLIGALNQKMLRLAGEIADGVILNYLPASAVGWCTEQVQIGERRAARSANSCKVYAYVHVGVCDPEEAYVRAQKDIFSYAVVDAYANAFIRAGYGEEISKLQRARKKSDRDAMIAAISPRMAQDIDFCGTDDEVRARIAQYRAAGVDHPIVMPLPWGKDRYLTAVETIEAGTA